MKYLIKFFLIACYVPQSLFAAETKYITDEFEVTMRSGTSTSNSIVRMLRSGEPVRVLEQDLASKYSLVESEDNRKGYILSRFLADRPAAKQLLQSLQNDYASLQQRIAVQTDEIGTLNRTLAKEKSDNEVLKNTLRASEQELTQIRTAAEDTLNIVEQNNRLKSVVESLRRQQVALTDENLELNDSTQLDWFVRGGVVSLLAFCIGILVTRIRWRKQDSWGSY